MVSSERSEEREGEEREGEESEARRRGEVEERKRGAGGEELG